MSPSRGPAIGGDAPRRHPIVKSLGELPRGAFRGGIMEPGNGVSKRGRRRDRFQRRRSRRRGIRGSHDVGGVMVTARAQPKNQGRDDRGCDAGGCVPDRQAAGGAGVVRRTEDLKERWFLADYAGLRHEGRNGLGDRRRRRFLELMQGEIKAILVLLAVCRATEIRIAPHSRRQQKLRTAVEASHEFFPLRTPETRVSSLIELLTLG